jgi:hypothetical protein
MPLDPVTLQSELETLFAEPPPGAAACADAWACAMLDYAAAVVPPSATVGAAADALALALEAACATPAAAPPVDAAFAAFAVTVGGGMAPAYAATPPPAPLGIAALLAAPVPTHAAAATLFAGLIDTWFRTGSATLVAPPFTVLPVWT